MIDEKELDQLLEEFERQYLLVQPDLIRIKDKLEDEFKQFFPLPPSGNDSFESAVDPFAYGVTEISARVKTVKSLRRNFRQKILMDARSSGHAESKPVYTLANLKRCAAENGTPKAQEWCRILPDLLGIRLIARSQRGKYQIYRAVEYLCDINQMIRVKKQELVVPKLKASSSSPWKYYNPPTTRAYYSPYVANRYHRAISEFGKQRGNLGTVDQQTFQQLGEGSTEQLETAEVKSALREAARVVPISKALAQTGIEFLMRDSGYATLQRSMKFVSRKIDYEFEIQIRTALEHCWAEPEHAMTYKTDAEPATEEVKSIFRSYGLSLVAADDALQMALDKYRMQNDRGADHSDRFLKPFRIKSKPRTIEETFDRDLKQIYNYIRLGFIGDAIVLVEQAEEKFKSDLRKRSILQIEEAICHLHNLTLLGDSETTVDVLLDVVKRSEGLAKANADKDDAGSRQERRFWLARLFWATFRLGHCKLLIAEFKYVQGRRKNGTSRALANAASVRKNVLEGFLQLDRVAEMLDDGEVMDALKDDVMLSESIRPEVQMMVARAWRWLADLVDETAPPAQLSPQLSKLRLAELNDEYRYSTDLQVGEPMRFACLRMAAAYSDKARQLVIQLREDDPDFEPDDYNDIDLAALNSALWFRRRLHHMHPDEGIFDESTTILNEILACCVGSNDGRRTSLHSAIEQIAHRNEIDEKFFEMISGFRVSELKILDTVIGYRAMAPRRQEVSDHLSSCNSFLARALVSVAARGDFAFDNDFAFDLLSDSRFRRTDASA